MPIYRQVPSRPKGRELVKRPPSANVGIGGCVSPQPRTNGRFELDQYVNLYRNSDTRPEQQQFVQVLREGCAFIGIEFTHFDDPTIRRRNWRHFINAKPSGSSYLDALLSLISSPIAKACCSVLI
jgi:hypothetical protein